MARQSNPAARLRWQSLIELQPQSGLTIAEFCEAHDVSTASFYQWRRKLAQAPADSPAFVPVCIDENKPANSLIRIRFDCGVVAEIPSDDQRSLAAVIDRLLATAEQADR